MSTSQNSSDFQHFLSGFEQLLISIEAFKSDSTVLLGHYNTKFWWDLDTTTYECMQIDNLRPSYSLLQLVNEPTHLVPSSLSCTDLIFTNQPGLVSNSGIHPSYKLSSSNHLL